MADTTLAHSTRKDTSPFPADKDDVNAFHFGFEDDMKAIPLPTATIKNVSEEPIFWHGYNSDEEMASPVAFDDLSISEDDFDDDDSNSLTSSRRSSSDESVESAQSTKSFCIQAQAITMLSVRPKMVEVPKMAAAHPAKRRLVNSIGGSSSDKLVVPGLRSASMETSRHEDATDTFSFASFEWAKGYSPPSVSGSSSIYSEAPGTVDDQPTPVTRNDSASRHVPLMLAARNLAPLTEAVADAVAPMAYGHRRSLSSSRPPLSTKDSMISMAEQYKKHEKTGLRRSPTFGSNFSIGNIRTSLLRRNDSIRDVEREYMEHLNKSRGVESHSPPLPIPSRSSSISTSRRLVARGGNERAPTITLPECPSDVEAAHWPFHTSTSDSRPSFSSPDRRPRKLQRHDAARITTVD
jgi:hypothetical protein